MIPDRRFRELRLFWKLLIPFATLLLIVGAFGAFVLIRDGASRAQATLNRDLQELSLQVRNTLQHHELYLLESANLVANLEGMAPSVARDDVDAVEDHLRSVVALKGELDVAGVITSGAGTLAALGSDGRPSAIGVDVDAPFVRLTLASTSGARQAGLLKAGDSTLLAVAAPICTATAPCTPAGVGIVGQDLDVVLGELERSALADRLTGGGIAIFDAGGSLVAGAGATPLTLTDVVLHGSRLVREVGQVGGVEVHSLFAPYQLQGEQRGTVVVTLPAGPAFEAVRGTGLRLTLVLMVALVGIVGVGTLVSRAILRQVRPLVATNQRLGSGDLSARVPIVSGDEIGEVARGLNQMAEHLQASYETLESRVEQRTAEIQRLLRQRTEFFASLSHELRTPLAIILSQSDLLLIDPADDDVAETGRAIRQSAAQLLGVVSEILELARAEAGRLEAEPVPTSLPRFLEDLRPTLNGLARGGDVDLRVEVSEDVPEVLADPQRLREIVINLVDNAIKYSAAGTTVEVTAAVEGDRVAVRVADEGSGIPADVGDRLFEPFFRVPGTAPRQGQASSGLGLALTRKLVEAHGGEITYESTPGAATTFAFTLPLAVPSVAGSNVAVRRARSRQPAAR